MNYQFSQDTIIAPSTSQGVAAIAIIRLSGPKAISTTDNFFKGALLKKQDSHTLHYGKFIAKDEEIDEVVVSIFKGPNSYTKQDVIEISCHGSPYIQQKIIESFLNAGIRMAENGEFTFRAFRNGRFNLSQAEAVAELIAADNKLGHKQALRQLKSGFTDMLGELREQLVHFASMLELENDFSEEDVEFASRTQLEKMIAGALPGVKRLMDSFKLGNAIKEGIPVVLAGKPNAGKSTLLNAILLEERAIVSEIPGTTRDTIEDVMLIDGIKFRFIDTAGLRETEDSIEKEGVERTLKKVSDAMAVVYLFDCSEMGSEKLKKEIYALELRSDQKLLLVANKTDLYKPDFYSNFSKEVIAISAKNKKGLEEIKSKLLELVSSGDIREGQFITNSRHFEALGNINESLEQALNHLREGFTSDLLALDIRQALHYIGELTGSISSDDILGNIFASFCIGK